MATPTNRGKCDKYGQWTEQDLDRAITSFKNGDAGLNATAKSYGIPKATLKRHIDCTNKYANGITKHFGRPCRVPPELEKSLVEHIIALENMLIGMTRKDLMEMIYQLAEQNSLRHNFNCEKKTTSKHWYTDFMRRHPDLSLRQAEATSIARARCFNRQSVMEFYNHLQTIIDKYGITANAIMNMDESGIQTVQKPGKVIARRGKKQVGSITIGEIGVTTTVVCCMGAGGTYIPPMIIFKRKRMAEVLKFGAPVGSIVTNNETGYMTKELFLDWLKHLVASKNCSYEKPIVLILDGHSTHTKNVEAIDYARENGMVILSLPPHTTHRLQSLDRVFYKPMMTFYNQESDNWLRTEKTAVTVYAVCQILTKAYVRAATMAMALNGFKFCGIWPFNPNIWSDVDFAANERFITTDSDSGDDATVTDMPNPTDAIEPAPVFIELNTTPVTEPAPVVIELNTAPVTEPVPVVVESNTTPVTEPAPVYSSSSLHSLNTVVSSPSSLDKMKRIPTNPDCRCFFRAVAINLCQELQMATRDDNGNITDLRLRISEMQEADCLRSKMINHMLGNFELYTVKNSCHPNRLNS